MTTVSTTHTFTGVLKGRTYNVTVLATNVIGEGTLAYTTIGEYIDGVRILKDTFCCYPTVHVYVHDGCSSVMLN